MKAISKDLLMQFDADGGIMIFGVGVDRYLFDNILQRE
jgi:hypothetical protein